MKQSHDDVCVRGFCCEAHGYSLSSPASCLGTWNMKIDIVWMGMGMDMDGYYGMGVVAILQHV